jgi:hypothetical protein
MISPSKLTFNLCGSLWFSVKLHRVTQRSHREPQSFLALNTRIFLVSLLIPKPDEPEQKKEWKFKKNFFITLLSFVNLQLALSIV